MSGASAAKGAVRRVVRFVGSFHVAVAILALLFLVVLVGTLAQRAMSIHDVQHAYFIPAFFVVWLGVVPIPLPGGLLLLAALVVNLVVGGIVRMRWGISTLGVLVAHIGVIVLLVGSYVEYLGSEKGYTARLYTGDSTDYFENDATWQLVVLDVASDREFVVAPDVLEAATGGATRRLVAAGLPFDLRLSGYVRNARPEKATSAGEGAEGYRFRSLPIDPKQAGANMPGAFVDVVGRDGAALGRGILWGAATAPYTVAAGGKTYAIDLRRERWMLPFRVDVKKIVGRMHPGTQMASEYSSYVRHVEGGVATDALVTMNAPLRHRGYTLYQSGYDEDERGPWTAFAVVKNPTDRVPIAACAIIGLGLLTHFVLKLVRYLGARSRVRAAHTGAEAPAGSVA